VTNEGICVDFGESLEGLVEVTSGDDPKVHAQKLRAALDHLAERCTH
jgi:hypothetical protein